MFCFPQPVDFSNLPPPEIKSVAQSSIKRGNRLHVVEFTAFVVFLRSHNGIP